MNIATSTDRRRQFDRVVTNKHPLGELTTVRQPCNRERKARWYAKVLNTDYPLDSGPRWGLQARDYEREQMATAGPELF